MEADLNVSADHFGIIATYRMQVAKIRRVLRARNLGNVRVGCIHDYQGQEARIVIISTVCGTAYLNRITSPRMNGVETPDSFLTDPKRFNVAMSRAMSLAIVVGHPLVLLEMPYVASQAAPALTPAPRRPAVDTVLALPTCLC